MMDKNGILIKNFNSISDAAKFLNIKLRRGSNSHIVDAARGRKTSAYGYKWGYDISQQK